MKAPWSRGIFKLLRRGSSGNVRGRCYHQVGLEFKRQPSGLGHHFHSLSSSRDLSHFMFGNFIRQA